MTHEKLDKLIEEDVVEESNSEVEQPNSLARSIVFLQNLLKLGILSFAHFHFHFLTYIFMPFVTN